MIIVDGFDHIELAKDEEDKETAKEEEEDSESEEENKDAKEPKAEEPKLQEWDCSVCTFINSINLGACDACGSPRPPMNEILAAF